MEWKPCRDAEQMHIACIGGHCIIDRIFRDWNVRMVRGRIWFRDDDGDDDNSRRGGAPFSPQIWQSSGDVATYVPTFEYISHSVTKIYNNIYGRFATVAPFGGKCERRARVAVAGALDEWFMTSSVVVETTTVVAATLSTQRVESPHPSRDYNNNNIIYRI